MVLSNEKEPCGWELEKT